MGIKVDVETELVIAFDNELADAVRTYTLRQNVSVFDETDNTVAVTPTDYSFRCIRAKLSTKELEDSSVQNTDLKIIIIQKELNATPKVDDFVVGAGLYAKIVKIMPDPSDAIWVVTCRE